MKFIHCADIHLDSKMETNLSSQKAKERKKEILNTFENMIYFAQENNVTAIIIAGDLFDTARITNLTKSRVINIIQKNNNIDFLYLSGNHDESNFIELIQDPPPNLKVFKNSWTTFDYNNINITGAIIDENNSATIYDTLNLNKDKLNI
ncbi:MAG: metallophosphoesterase, partial [Clostridia bacterium]|nr:metallophosphoesterase [Clostridia bacterium]